MSEDFYQSKAWKRLREKALLKWSRVCMKCKSKEDIEVDHVLPRSVFPSLALRLSNLGILCKPCNQKKSARIEPDYRPKSVRYYFIFIKTFRWLLAISLVATLTIALYFIGNYNTDLADLPLSDRIIFEVEAVKHRFK